MSSAMRRKRRAGDAPSTMRGRGGKRARGGAGTGAGGAGAGAGVNTSRQARRALDEEIDWAYESDDSSTDNAHNADSDGGSSGVSDDAGSGSESDGGGDVPETADERKLRLAKQLLARISSSGNAHAGGSDSSSNDDSDDDALDNAAKRGVLGVAPARDAVTRALRMQAQAAAGAVYRRLAADVRTALKGRGVTGSSLPLVDRSAVTAYRGHKLSPTCVALTSDDTVAFTGGKDSCVVRWDLETGKKVVFPGMRTSASASRARRRARRNNSSEPQALDGSMAHSDTVLAVAASSDGRLVATAGLDRTIVVWDVRTSTVAETFTGHRDAVSCLAFRRNTHTLFSGSFDRTVKIWNLDDMAYVDTRYGHQSPIQSIDSLVRERAVTCGADRTVRLWKVVDESQLVFRGTADAPSMDCVAMVDEKHFVSGAQGGEVALWFVGKKKPMATIPVAHGTTDEWISSLGMLPGSDLLATGSCDGVVRLWDVDTGAGSLTPVGGVPMDGFVNGVQFARSGKFMVAAVGQEHRLGRWWHNNKVHNGLRVVDLHGVVPQLETGKSW